MPILDILGDDEMKPIQATMKNVIAYSNVVRKFKHIWIPNNVMYGPTKIGGFNTILIKNILSALKSICICRHIKSLGVH